MASREHEGLPAPAAEPPDATKYGGEQLPAVLAIIAGVWMSLASWGLACSSPTSLATWPFEPRKLSTVGHRSVLA
jgi:hypothetical protein